MSFINRDSFIQNCLASAVFSTTAAVGMKHAFNSSLPHIVKGYLCATIDPLTNNFFKEEDCYRFVETALPLLQFAIMMPLNTKALQHTLRAMHITSTSRAVLTTLAFSFVLGGLIGYFVFGEPVNIQWWLGIAVVMTGVYLLSITKTDSEVSTSKKKLKST